MKRSLVLLVLLTSACAKDVKPNPEPVASKPAATAASKPATAGKAISATKKVALADLVRNSSSYKDQTLVTEGTVKRVCQTMGCWMEIVDDKSQAHVKFAEHAFFVPKDCHGKKARIEGKVLAAEAAADSCKAEGCRKGNPADEGLAQVEFEATGVELL